MTQTLIRPAWTPATIALMVLGFMIFWPLGLAMLAYILWGERLEDFKQGVNRATDNICGGFSRNSGADFSKPRFGNVALDEWYGKELERLHEQRRQLDETIAEFEDFKRELHRERDNEEFDGFMKTRKRKPAPRSKGKSGGKTQRIS